MEKTIDLYSAIAEMRKLTKAGKSFSFSFMSYYRDKQSSQGIVHVARAKLRKATPKEDNQNADIMLNYLNLDGDLPRQCYQPALMHFNGVKIQLN